MRAGRLKSDAMEIKRLNELDCRVEPYDWRYAAEKSEEIDAHWRKLCASTPSLYNGRVLLMHHWCFDGVAEASVLRSRHFETDFKSFIGWRDLGFRDSRVRNCFSMAALRSSDSAWMLGVMAPQTSNAGMIYFPAGTPDPGDVIDGTLDLAGSALRELSEETGLEVGDVEVARDWSVVDAGPRLGLMKIMQARDDAKTLLARIERNLSLQDQPELAGMHVVRTRRDIVPGRMPDFMVAWLEAMLS